LITAVATHRFSSLLEVAEQLAAESKHDTSMRAFKIHAAACTTILPAVASSPSIARDRSESATMGTEMRRQIVTT
jgi:hypothetical protein